MPLFKYEGVVVGIAPNSQNKFGFYVIYRTDCGEAYVFGVSTRTFFERPIFTLGMRIRVWTAGAIVQKIEAI